MSPQVCIRVGEEGIRGKASESTLRPGDGIKEDHMHGAEAPSASALGMYTEHHSAPWLVFTDLSALHTPPLSLL